MEKLNDVTFESVLQAIKEYDRFGQDVFLKEYGFRRAKIYWLIWNEKRYDSKAIAGVA